MSAPDRPRLSMFTGGLSSLSQEQHVDSPTNSVNSPIDQNRKEAKANLFKKFRLPTQHIWAVYFDRQSKEKKKTDGGDYQESLEKLDTEISTVEDFWKYFNHFKVEQMSMRDSLYLFQKDITPVWEDRRNVLGGSWTFRVPKSSAVAFWEKIQLMAIGEVLEDALEKGDQICGVGLSVRFNSHLISIWHRHASMDKSVENLKQVVLNGLPEELRPKPENYFYKKHSDHAGFDAPEHLKKVIASQNEADAAKIKAKAKAEAEAEAAAAKATASAPVDAGS